MQIRPAVRLALIALAGCSCLAVQAQVTQVSDGRWHSLYTAGASLASGNTDAKSVSFGADAVKMTLHDKWSLNAAGQYTHTNGARTANRLGGSGRYALDITPDWFGFTQLDLLRDLPAAISLRSALGEGLGYHVLKLQDNSWDVLAGLAYTVDRYSRPLAVDDVERTQYSHAELLLSEDSNHKLSENTSFKQKLTVFPDLQGSGRSRATFDAALSVAMTQRLSLTASLAQRYDSHPGQGLGKNDTLFLTGVSLRVD